MTPAGLCQVYNLPSSVAALGAFAAASKPPQRTLSCLRNSTRDVRLLLDEQLATSALSTFVAHSTLSSQPASSLPSTISSTLLQSIQTGNVDQAVTEYKRLHSRQAVLEPDLVKELIKGLCLLVGSSMRKSLHQRPEYTHNALIMQRC